MKKINVFKFCILLILFVSFCSACNSSYDDMIKDFNEQYFALEPTAPKNDSLTDGTFSADKMLEKRYTFIKGYESSLAAPEGGAKYDWTLKTESVDGEKSEKVCSERIYNFMPGEDIKMDVETNLVLTVTDASGTEYIDTALIIVISRN